MTLMGIGGQTIKRLTGWKLRARPMMYDDRRTPKSARTVNMLHGWHDKSVDKLRTHGSLSADQMWGQSIRCSLCQRDQSRTKSSGGGEGTLSAQTPCSCLTVAATSFICEQINKTIIRHFDINDVGRHCSGIACLPASQPRHSLYKWPERREKRGICQNKRERA